MSTKFRAFLKDTAIRAVKTMAQTALSLFTIGQAVTDVSWTSVISISLVSGLYSVLTSIVNYNIKLDSPDDADMTDYHEKARINHFVGVSKKVEKKQKERWKINSWDS